MKPAPRAFPPLLAAISMFCGQARAATATVVYTYDPVGRVATALYDNGVCIAYTYDANGNRTSQTNTTSSAPETPTWGSGVWGCFAWTAAGARLEGRSTVRAAAVALEKKRQ